jgi:acyl-coenzyme A thioesterase 13
VQTPDGFTSLTTNTPFVSALEPLFLRDGSDPPVVALRAEERHTNHRGTVMGGMLATLVDLTLGLAVAAGAAEAEGANDRATASLTIDYLKPANPGEWIEATPRVDRVGETLAFAECLVTADGREIVRARSVWAG